MIMKNLLILMVLASYGSINSNNTERERERESAEREQTNQPTDGRANSIPKLLL